MKKIAHVLGSKRLTADIVMSAEVARNLKGRFSFDFLIPKDAEYRDKLCDIGARVISFGEPSSISGSQVLGFMRYFLSNPADIVHTHVSFSARVGARLAGVKKCISTRSHSQYPVIKGKKKAFRSALYNAFTTLTVCHSSSLCDSLVSEGVRRDKIFSLCPRSEKKMGGAVPRYSLPAEPVILCPIPFLRGFGHSTLVRAFARLPRELCARLVFVGDGSEREECRLLACSLGVGERVEFLRSDMLTKVYNLPPSIVIFPEEYGWEAPTVELTGISVPIVASDIPENVETLSGACEFFLSGDEFSLSRTMLRLLSDKQAYSAAALASSRVAVPAEQMCETYERIYSALLSL